MRDFARKLAILIALTLLGTGTVGCGPVASFEPIYTEKDLVFDPTALGVWYDSENDAHVHVTQVGDKAYRLVYIATPERGVRELAVFEAHLVKLKDHLFLDLYPNFLDDGVSRLSAWYNFSLHGVHQIGLVKQLRPGPVVAFMRGDYWDEHAPTIRHRRLMEGDEDSDSAILLTASTKKVQRFLRRAVKRGAFDDDEQTLKFSASKATALHFAAAQGNSKEIKELLEKGVAVNARDEEDRTPLHWATDLQQTAVFAPLIAAGANVNAKDAFLGTPLYNAIFRDQEEKITVVETLLVEGADVTVKNKDGRTALHIAALRGSAAVVSMLLIKGADIHARDNDGSTPLHVAASWGFVAAVELLLAEGADVNAKDNKGKTPLDGARARKNEEAIELLKRHGAKSGE